MPRSKIDPQYESALEEMRKGSDYSDDGYSSASTTASTASTTASTASTQTPAPPADIPSKVVDSRMPFPASYISKKPNQPATAFTSDAAPRLSDIQKFVMNARKYSLKELKALANKDSEYDSPYTEDSGSEGDTDDLSGSDSDASSSTSDETEDERGDVTELKIEYNSDSLGLLLREDMPDKILEKLNPSL